jgi:uncharacterized protein YndB with AHSA1/START domain
MSSGAETVTREFTIVIDAEPTLVWAALTSPEYTTEWWFANTVESTWEVGAPIRYLGEDGLPYVLGEVLVIEPPRRLATTFHPVWADDASAQADTRVQWRLDPFDEPADQPRTRVTLTHSGVVPGSVLDRETSPGWSYLLESLKKLLED